MWKDGLAVKKASLFRCRPCLTKLRGCFKRVLTINLLMWSFFKGTKANTLFRWPGDAAFDNVVL